METNTASHVTHCNNNVHVSYTLHQTDKNLSSVCVCHLCPAALHPSATGNAESALQRVLVKVLEPESWEQGKQSTCFTKPLGVIDMYGWRHSNAAAYREVQLIPTMFISSGSSASSYCSKSAIETRLLHAGSSTCNTRELMFVFFLLSQNICLNFSHELHVFVFL